MVGGEKCVSGGSGGSGGEECVSGGIVEVVGVRNV